MTFDKKPLSSDSRTANVPRSSFEAARVARLAAVQALFQIRTAGDSASTVIHEFIQFRFSSDDYPHQPDLNLFKSLVLKVQEREEELIRLIEAHLSEPWTCATLEPVLREILSAGALELLDPQTKAPAPVIISEYIDLTRGFLSTTEAQLCNAVLDGIAKTLGLQLKK